MTKYYKLLEESSNEIHNSHTHYFNIKCGDSTRHQRALARVMLYIQDKTRFFFASTNTAIEFVDKCAQVYQLQSEDIDIIDMLRYLRQTVTPAQMYAMTK